MVFFRVLVVPVLVLGGGLLPDLASDAARAATGFGAAAEAGVVPARSTPAMRPELIVGVVAGGRPPLEVLDGGKLTGFSADYLRLLVGTGATLVPRVFADMPALLSAACRGEIDIIMSRLRAPEHDRCLAVTAPYLSGNSAFVTRAGNEGVAMSAARLARARIAVEKGFVLEKVLHEQFPQARILAYTSTPDALRAVDAGAADTYAGFAPAVRYELSLDTFRDLRLAHEERNRVQKLRFAVPLSKEALRDRLNAAFAGVRPADAAAVRARWLAQTATSAAPTLKLSDDERSWLSALPALKVGVDDDWPPFSSGRLRRPGGIAGDYLDYLARALGVTFQPVPFSAWHDVAGPFSRGELALLVTSAHDATVDSSALFTQPIEHYPLVLVGRSEEPMARGIEDFAGRRIALGPHMPALSQIFADVRAVHVARASNVQAGLRMVAQYQADVLVGNAAALDVRLSRGYAGTLKVLGVLDTNEAVSLAARPDLAPLVALIDRALAAMPLAERERIRNRWVTGGPGVTGGWSVNALRLLPFVIVFGVVLLVTLRAYVLLQREMRRRRRAEHILARQVELQDTVMEMIPYPLGARDLAGRYIAVNRAYEEITGLQRARVIGRDGTSVLAWGADNDGPVEELFQRAVREGGNQRVELAFDGPGGESRHGIFWMRLCRDAHGKPLCVLGTMIEITEIRRAEMRARESERLLSDVTRSLPVLVFRLRRSSFGAYSFPYLGGDSQRLLGDDVQELMRARTLDVVRVHRHDRKRLRAQLERSARRLEPVNTEFRYFGGAGLVWVRAEFVPHLEEDGAVLWSGYAVDANVEHARADELARARDLAEAASRAKDDFLAMMSHEIRTPMNGVLGLVEVLERTPLNPDQTQMISMVHESAGALLQILDDLLDYSKIQAGRLVIVSEPFDVRELVDNAVGLLAGRAHEKGLKVRVDVEPGVAATLRGDSVRLRQILFNLLSNAIKFTSRGEVSVLVSAQDVPDTGAPASQILSLVVADTGIGIAPDAQTRLFEPFVQVETTTTRRFGGTGLGLTICRRLAALMDGTLELHSAPGRGTDLTLRIELPVEVQSVVSQGLRGKRALVVCDDERVAAALMHFGETLGMHMTSASDTNLDANTMSAYAGIDLVLASESCAADMSGLGAAVIGLTDNPKPTGYRVAETGVRLSVNPLSWRGLNAACAMALVRPQVVPEHSSGVLAPALAVPDREKERAAGRLILVAEDHPVNRELISHQLALLGFACDVVNDGAEALVALEKNHYGCLITDCHMPDVSGYDLARRVRESESRRGGTRRLPILAITANTAPENLHLCREAGMDDCIIKPTRVATLREHLAHWFGAQGVNRATPEPAPAIGPQPPAPVAAGAIEPLDLARMIQVWGSETLVKGLLDAFVPAFRDDLDALPPLLEAVDVARLREWHHRVAGAVGVLQYPVLFALLDTFRSHIDVYRRHISTHTAAQLRDAGRELISTCNTILDAIAQQARSLAQPVE
ncbi:ATP-binding protein [Paraburkholderia adhaesiva]|uniref:ATP-binding protein n=1 Tax=Paraburkholderia adhaesiva TaxID=2883244 RepID=UPI001F38FEDA|nr:transporter substrate-binding domain-containing protein [Paraburkholderia adhaesiva]